MGRPRSEYEINRAGIISGSRRRQKMRFIERIPLNAQEYWLEGVPDDALRRQRSLDVF